MQGTERLTKCIHARSNREGILGTAVPPKHAKKYETSPSVVNGLIELFCTFLRNAGPRLSGILLSPFLARQTIHAANASVFRDIQVQV